MCLCPLDNQVIVTYGYDGTQLWDIRTEKSIMNLDYRSTVGSLCAKDDYSFITGSKDKTIKVWDERKNKCTTTLVGHRGSVVSLYKLHWNTITSGSDNGVIRFWDLDSKKCCRILIGNERAVKGTWASNVLDFQPKLVTGADSIKIWGIEE